MATAVLDPTRLNDAETTTNWHILDSSSKATLNPDFVYQGSNSISRKVGKSAIDGVEYDPAAGRVDFISTPKVWLAKVICATPSLISATRAQYLSVRIGSAETDYQLYNIFTATDYPPTNSWIIIPVDPNLPGFVDSTVGTPLFTGTAYFAVQAQMTATTLGENIAMDAIDYMDSGNGALMTGTSGLFQDFIDEDEGQATTGRAGVIYTVQDIIFIVGKLRIGDTNPVIFSDSNKTLVFVTGITNTGFSGIDVDVSNVSSDVDFNSITLSGRGLSATKKFFDTALQVTGGATDTVTLLNHGYETLAYVLYSNEGGADAIGLTDGQNYWVFVIDTDTIALHATRASAFGDTTRVGLTAAAAPGENHSFLREPDNRPDLTISGENGAFDTDASVIDTHRQITLTPAATITGGQIINSGKVIASTGVVNLATISGQTTTEGEAFFDPLADLSNLTNCTFVSTGEGHIARLTQTGSTSFDNATLTDWWTPASNGTKGWNFATMEGIDAATDRVTTDANHGFSTGMAVFYNNEGGTDAVGLTAGNKYYARPISNTVLSLHATRAAAIDNSSLIALATGSAGETHSLYSGNAPIFNDTSGSATINVLNNGDTPAVRNGLGSTTTVVNAVTLTVTVTSAATGQPIPDVSVFIDEDPISTPPTIASGITNASGVFSTSFAFTVEQAVTVRARKRGLVPAQILSTITSTGLSVPVTMQTDQSGDPV